MPRPEEYEVLILGSRKSGKSLAWNLAGSGHLPYTLFRDAILTHPTMAEGLNALFATVPAAER